MALDHAAEQWANGAAATAALQSVGYLYKSMATFHATGQVGSADELLRRLDCRKLADPGLHDFGLYRRGADNWLVLASVRAAAPAHT